MPLTLGSEVLNSEQSNREDAAPRGPVTEHGRSSSVAISWIREGTNAIKWTKLSCRTFKDIQTRLQLFALAHNLGNFLRRLTLPKVVKGWSL